MFLLLQLDSLAVTEPVSSSALDIVTIYNSSIGINTILIALLFTGLFLSFERIFIFNKFKQDALDNTTKAIKPLLRNPDIEKICRECEKIENPYSRVFLAGFNAIPTIGYNFSDISNYIDNSIDIEESELSKHLSYIIGIASMAPAIGFFGTIMGMIRSFDALVKVTDRTPSITDLASGMGEAMGTTFMGLATAIIIGAFYHFLKGKLEKRVRLLEMSRVKFYELMHDMKFSK